MFRAWVLFNCLFVAFLFPKEEKPFPFAYPAELIVAIEAAKEAGSILLQYWNRAADLAIADSEAHDAICNKLLAAFPKYGLVSEHSAVKNWKTAEWAWVVDSLDGAHAFQGGRAEFGIQIALMRSGAPVMGVCFYPVKKALYFAIEGFGAYKQVKKRRPAPIRAEQKAMAVRPAVSDLESPFFKSYYEKLLGMPLTKKMLRKDFKVAESIGLQLCLVAEGKRNISVSGEGRIWEYAAASVILKEAGGSFSDLTGKPLDFIAECGRLHYGTLSCGPKVLYNQALLAAKAAFPEPVE